MKPTLEHLNAIESCDVTYDTQFLYGVKSTHIFCKPSCRSRFPAIENIEIFAIASEAQAAGFRPCKRCRPDQLQLPDEQWIDTVVLYIQSHYMLPLTLELVAEETHSSPYYLHRKFKAIHGMTIHDFIVQCRITEAKRLLTTSRRSISEIGRSIGILNATQFTRDFKKVTGTTPTQYRKEYYADI